MNLSCLGRASFPAIFIAWLWPILPSHAAQTADVQQAHTQVLASSCAACHGTGGNSLGSMPPLAGMNTDHFIRQMTAFRTGARSSTVMHHHAKGLTKEEIHLLAEHFSRQSKRPGLPPPH